MFNTDIDRLTQFTTHFLSICEGTYSNSPPMISSSAGVLLHAVMSVYKVIGVVRHRSACWWLITAVCASNNKIRTVSNAGGTCH